MSEPKKRVFILSGSGGGGSAAWGAITGTLSDQTDLQTALDAKQPLDSDLTSWAGVTRAANFDTFSATPSSANLRALLTDETGTGGAYFAGGNAGTPSAINLGNGTALPDGGLTLTDVTTNNASTTAHGFLVKATAPAANVLNVVGIANGETVYTNKALFDGTNPAALGTAAPGTSLIAAHRDHVHANPAIDTLAAATDITTLNASTTAHGLLVKATAPSAGLRNVVGIDNSETAYTNKALFDATVPAAIGTAATGSAMTAARRDHVHPIPTIGSEIVVEFAASDVTTAIAVGTVKFSTRARWGLTLTAVRASVVTAPTGSTILIDVNKNGTTVLSTKLMIDATELTSVTATTPYVISVSAFADDDVISVDFDQVGSTIAGAGVVIALYFTRTS